MPARRPGADARRSTRRPVSFQAQMREPAGKAASVQMADLSLEGFQIEHHKRFRQGANFWLRLPGIEALPAHAIWSDGKRLGCRFEAPLHSAVLDRLLGHQNG